MIDEDALGAARRFIKKLKNKGFKMLWISKKEMAKLLLRDKK